jgi:hypothetical protein
MRNYKYLFIFVSLICINSAHAQTEKTDFSSLNHPYLFFTKNDLPEIRERLTREPFKTRWEIFLRNADAVIRTPVHQYDSGQRKAGRARKHLENAGKTAFAYIITGEEKYSRRAIEEAMAMADGIMPEGNDAFVWYNPSSRGWNKGADLNTAEICYGMAMVYDWCYDALTEPEKKMIANALLEKGIHHFLHSIEREKPDFWVGNPVSNWAGVLNGGVGLGALAIYNESEQARKATEYASKYVIEFLDHVFLEDGGGHEGIMYARYGELFSLYYLMAHQRLFGLEEEMLETFIRKAAGYWDVYLQAPDMKYANFNNMAENTFEGLWGLDKRMQGGPNSDINALMEILVPGGDSLLLWAADNGAPRFYWNGASPWYFLWRRSDALPVLPEQKPALQEAVLFRGAGHTVFRSGTMWLAFNGGWTSNRSHNNRDLGSFVLVLDQERMVNDPGYGDGHALNHSTVIVNNEDQIQGEGGKYLNFGSGDSFHYLATDLTDAYNREHVNKFIRHVLMVKDAYIVILDEIGVNEAAEVEWRLQTRHPADSHLQEHAIVHGEKHKLFVVNAADQTQTNIIVWEGKNGKMNAVSKKPVIRKDEYLIATVLIPGDIAGTDEFPSASFNDGELSIRTGNAGTDLILFSKGENRWVLRNVNDEKNILLTDGSERSLKLFRRDEKHTVDLKDLPSWFFPFKN